MEIEQVAKSLKELGHPKRLAAFKELVKSGNKGLPVGVLQEKLNIPASTLTHHIKGLEAAGLITQKREGRTLYCVPQYQHLMSIIVYLQDECCIDQ